ncbi:hypothetical protein KUM39_21450 [Streptomyces sp. J2-1]|uniref:hypothetical protein n=1 Tax=Streptomyces corallincola TaxID=2851888 RepID=UPI001C38CFA1|nr:hypothetical protein [Streptomyces corallincola]MBV2356908.1 hypothetical protein [Streptomyces corallincola]
MPIAGLSSLLRFAHENTDSRHRRLRQNIDIGLQFGTEAAALFVQGEVNGLGHMDPKLVALVQSWPDAMEIRGFLALVYTHVAALGYDHAMDELGAGTGDLVKNQMAVLSRTSLSGIRNGLSRNAKRFLAANAPQIKNRIAQLFHSSLLLDEEFGAAFASLPLNLLTDEMDMDITVGTYLDTALTDQPAEIVDSASQRNVFGTHTEFTELDTNDGNLDVPLVLLELRFHGPVLTMDREMRPILERVVEEARTIHDEVVEARATSHADVQANITALRNATSTAHPETRSLHTLLAAANQLEIELPQRVNDRMLMPDRTVLSITSATLAAIELRSTDTADQNVLQLRQTGHTELLRFADRLQALLPQAPVHGPTLQAALDAAHELAGHLDPAQTHAPDGHNISRLRNDVNLQLQAWNQPAVHDGLVLELYTGLGSHITRLSTPAIAQEIAGRIVTGGRHLGLPGGGKKKKAKKTAAPQTTTDTLSADTPVAGPSSSTTTAPTIPSDPLPADRAQEARELWRALPDRRYHHEGLAMEAVRQILAQNPPSDLDLLGLVDAVDRALHSPLDLRARLLSRPQVMHTAATRPELIDFLAHAPELTDLLDERPSVLAALANAADSWFEEDEEPAKILARPGVLQKAEADPELRTALFEDSPDTLVNLDGRLDLVLTAYEMHDTMRWLIDGFPEFGQALAAEGKNAPELMWRLHIRGGLSAALYSVLVNRPESADPLPPAYFTSLLTNTVFLEAVDGAAEQTMVALTSETTIAHVTADPTILQLLAGSPTLTDVLEDRPRMAETLLGNREALSAAVTNPNVATALSYDPTRYAGLSGAQLVQELTTEPGPVTQQQPYPTSEQAATLVPLKLLKALRNASPAVDAAVSGFSANEVPIILANEGVLRLIARNPDSGLLPHVLRRILTRFPTRSALPENDTAALAATKAAGRFCYVRRMYADDMSSTLEPLARLLGNDPDLADALTRLPSTGYLAYWDMRPFTDKMPLSLLRAPYAATALRRIANLAEEAKTAGSPVAAALEAGNGALALLASRHEAAANPQTEEWWAQAARNVVAHPAVLDSLAEHFTALPFPFWKQLLESAELFGLLGERLDTPMGELIRWQAGVLREVLRRPGFTQAWRERQAEFDTLAQQVLTEADTSDQTIPANRDRLLDMVVEVVKTVEATGHPALLWDGAVIDPANAVPMTVLQSSLRERKSPGELREAAATASLELSDETVARYTAILSVDTLRDTALEHAHLGEYMLFRPGMLDLFRTRPSTVRRVGLAPKLLHLALSTPGVPALLAANDRLFDLFISDPKMRGIFIPELMPTLRANPDYADAYWAENPVLLAAHPYAKEVDELVKASPAVARTVMARALKSWHDHLPLWLSRSPKLVDALSETDESVRAAIVPFRDRLEAAAEDPASVSAVARVPGMAAVLATTTSIVQSRDEWLRLTRSDALLDQLAAHPDVLSTVLTADVLPVALAHPALVTTLARVPAEVRELLTGPAFLGLIREHPGLADDLADQDGLRAALIGLRGLPELLAQRPDLLDTLRTSTATVAAIRANRALLEEATTNSPVWTLVVAHPELAPTLNARLRGALNHHPAAATLITAHPEPLDPELLSGALRRGGVLAVMATHPDLGHELLTRPTWQERAAADRDFAETLRRLAGLPTEQRTTLLTDDTTLWTTLTTQAADTGLPTKGKTREIQRQARETDLELAGVPSRRTPITTPATTQVQAQTQWPELPAEVVALLTGPHGTAVADHLATAPELLPLLTALPLLAEEIDAHPERLTDYTIRTYLETHLPTPDETTLNDPAIEDAYTPQAFERHFAAYLESHDLAPGTHYTTVRTAAAHTWHHLTTTHRTTLNQLRTQRAERFTRLRPHDSTTWELSGRIHHTDRLTAKDFTPAQHQTLQRVAQWAQAIREERSELRLHHPLHAHLDNGSAGAAFIYTLAPDGRVDLLVHALSTTRSNNRYRWTGSNQYISGPPATDNIANHPTLTTSHTLLTNLPTHTTPPTTHTSAVDSAALAHATQATHLADAIRAYHRALTTQPHDAHHLLNTAHTLRQAGIDPFTHHWHTLTPEQQTHATTLTTEHTEDPHYLGALALAHQTGGNTLVQHVAHAQTHTRDDHKLSDLHAHITTALHKANWPHPTDNRTIDTHYDTLDTHITRLDTPAIAQEIAGRIMTGGKHLGLLGGSAQHTAPEQGYVGPLGEESSAGPSTYRTDEAGTAEHAADLREAKAAYTRAATELADAFRVTVGLRAELTGADSPLDAQRLETSERRLAEAEERFDAAERRMVDLSLVDAPESNPLTRSRQGCGHCPLQRF